MSDDQKNSKEKRKIAITSICNDNLFHIMQFMDIATFLLFLCTSKSYRLLAASSYIIGKYFILDIHLNILKMFQSESEIDDYWYDYCDIMWDKEKHLLPVHGKLGDFAYRNHVRYGTRMQTLQDMVQALIFNNKYVSVLMKLFIDHPLRRSVMCLRTYVLKTFEHQGINLINLKNLSIKPRQINRTEKKLYNTWEVKDFYGELKFKRVELVDYQRDNVCDNYSTFDYKFMKKYGTEYWFSALDWNYFFISGGAVACNICPWVTLSNDSDIDIFSLNVVDYKHFIDLVMKFVAVLMFRRVPYTFEHSQQTVQNIVLYKLELNGDVKEVNLQFIYTGNNLSTTLHNFDISFCQIAWLPNKRTILCTEAFRQTIETGVSCNFTLGEEGMKDKLMYRFRKYITRGLNFWFIPKHINMEKLMCTINHKLSISLKNLEYSRELSVNNTKKKIATFISARGIALEHRSIITYRDYDYSGSCFKLNGQYVDFDAIINDQYGLVQCFLDFEEI